MKTLAELKMEGIPKPEVDSKWEECFKKIVKILGDNPNVKWIDGDTEKTYLERFIRDSFTGKWKDLIKINKFINFNTGSFVEANYVLSVITGIELLSSMSGYEAKKAKKSVEEIMDLEHENWKILDRLKKCFPLTIREYNK